MKLSKDICNYINNVLGYLTTENVFQKEMARNPLALGRGTSIVLVKLLIL